MKEHLSIFGRGFLIVSLISLNTIQLSQGRWSAPVVGFCIAIVWWLNARSANRVDGTQAMLCYASGSALGTAMGLWLGGL
tara:strand:- start:13904 stop:14143 length:240 start_codon:yes stop_codon:yes gene_type:complete